MKIHFIRHGKRDRRQIGDPGLTAAGRTEAGLLAAALAVEPVAAVYSSPLARAGETAAIIATTLGLTVVNDGRLRERMNWGDCADQSFDEFIAQWERCSQERDDEPAVGDSSRAAGQRLASFAAAGHQASAAQTVVAVTHGGVLADFLRNVFTPAALDRVQPAFSLAPYSGEVIPECSVTTLVYDGEDYDLEVIGALLFKPVD